MIITDNKNRLGTYHSKEAGNEKYKVFIPAKLPPNPPIVLSSLALDLEKANKAIGRLSSVAEFVPDTQLFMYMYVRKEALLSSQIEGTQSTFEDLFLFENTEEKISVPISDVEEVSNYVKAISYGLERMKKLPLSLRLIKEIHAILLKGTRGHNKSPGEFRSSQNWIGGTRPGTARFVPPSPEKLMEVLGDFEKFIHNEDTNLPILVRAGLIHVQFETIHPFLDGNGRLGRLLITLFLCHQKVLKEPLLYLSLFFKTHRDLYYDHLQTVRTKGDWEGWLKFFLEGITETANQAVETTKKMIALFSKDEEKIKGLGGKASPSALLVYRYLQKKPYVSVPIISKELEITQPTARSALKNLESLGIVKETSKKQRNLLFVYKEYIDLLGKNVEPF